MRTLMSLEQAILEAVRELPPDKQREVLRHASELRDHAIAGVPSTPRKSVKGLWRDLGVSLSSEEIESNQREIWKGFPKDT